MFILGKNLIIVETDGIVLTFFKKKHKQELLEA